MLSPTLREGLKSYAIGPKIRAIRLKKKMGLVELGRHTGLSPAMLSKVERGQLFPTLPTLLRIALVFSVGLEYFFAAERDRPVVAVARHQDRLRFPEKQGARDLAYEFESLDFPAVQRLLNSYYAEFLPCRRGSCGATSIRARSFSTCSPARSPSSLPTRNTCSRPAIRSTSTPPCRTPTARPPAILLRHRRHDGLMPPRHALPRHQSTAAVPRPPPPELRSRRPTTRPVSSRPLPFS